MIQERKATHRSGYTLIEMVIVIGAATMVMGLAASLLGACSRSSGAAAPPSRMHLRSTPRPPFSGGYSRRDDREKDHAETRWIVFRSDQS